MLPRHQPVTDLLISLWKRSDTGYAQGKVLDNLSQIHNSQSFINMFVMQTRQNHNLWKTYQRKE